MSIDKMIVEGRTFDQGIHERFCQAERRNKYRMCQMQQITKGKKRSDIYFENRNYIKSLSIKPFEKFGANPDYSGWRIEYRAKR